MPMEEMGREPRMLRVRGNWMCRKFGIARSARGRPQAERAKSGDSSPTWPITSAIFGCIF